MRHAVALVDYGEPGITWTYAHCSCGWIGPYRVLLEQAAIDTARHQVRPSRVDFEDDWMNATGDQGAKALALYEPVFAPWEIGTGPPERDDPRR